MKGNLTKRKKIFIILYFELGRHAEQGRAGAANISKRKAVACMQVYEQEAAEGRRLQIFQTCSEYYKTEPEPQREEESEERDFSC